MVHFKFFFLILTLIPFSWGFRKNNNSSQKSSIKYLALGDSYTIGESVCKRCSFPVQLTEKLNEVLDEKASVKIIAKTGWTTNDLLAAIDSENPSNDYDLVTLLIGVNNQYQGQLFSVYEEEFPKLLDKAIKFAKGKPENVMVLSIPDYSFTPFGQNSGKGLLIGAELKGYNAYAEKVSSEKGVRFENITPITQRGLENPELIASDGLHPSEKAYKKFVELIYENVLAIIR